MTLRSSRIVWRGPAIERATDEALARGANRAVERLYGIVVPFTPYLDGDLTRAYGIHLATPATVHEGAQLQNSSVYAVFQHEGGDGDRTIRRHTLDPHPAARTKFVEAPMRAARDELYGIIAGTVREALS